MLVAALRWFCVPADRRRAELLFVFSAICGPVSILFTGVLVALSFLCPVRYDFYIYGFSESVMGLPSFRVAQIAETHLWFKELLGFSYSLFFGAIVVTLAVYLWVRTEEQAIQVAKTFALNCCAALGFYLILPASGPRYAFPGFPHIPIQQTMPHLAMIGGPPNCVPSVHMSNALLVFWFLRDWRWGRIAAGLFIILTAAATLGTGEHYMFDLFCSVPYAAGVLWSIHGFDGMRTTDGLTEDAQLKAKASRVALH